MRAFLARRLLVALLLVWGALTLVFLLSQLAPGGPFRMEPGPGVSPEAGDAPRSTNVRSSTKPHEWVGLIFYNLA